MTWRKAAQTDALDVGETMRFDADGHDYLLARVSEDRWCAADLSCTHRYAELDATGALVKCQLTCISHGATFDLCEGGRVVTPALATGETPPLRTFPTERREDGVYVDVPEGDKPPEPPW